MLMYGELASWWPLLSAPEEYEAEAAWYAGILRGAGGRRLLELGSGGGNNASHLKAEFEMTLVDLAPGMVAVSEALNPGCRHVVGDMREVRLGETFDAVFVHDAIGYMLTEEELRRAIETVWVHCRPGGLALLTPDYLRETFQPSTDCGGHDGDGRAMRYLEWTWRASEDADIAYTDYTYTLRDRDGSIRVLHERHEEGLFSRETWLRLLRDVGFRTEIQVIEHEDWFDVEAFVARKPADAD